MKSMPLSHPGTSLDGTSPLKVKTVPQLENSIALTIHLVCLVAGLVFSYFHSKVLCEQVQLASFFGVSEANSPANFIQHIWSGLIVVANFFILALAIVFTGSRLRALGNIVHECSHDIFLTKSRDNQILGNLLSLLLLQSFRRYQDDHRSHHKYLGLFGSQKFDQDLSRYQRLFQESGTENNLFKQLALALKPENLKVAYQWTFWNTKDGLFTNSLRVAYALSMFCFVVYLFTAAILHESVIQRIAGCISIFAALTPVVIIYPVLCVWSDIADHCTNFRASGKLDALALSRNHAFKLEILNLLFFPRNDGYHLVHHLFPSQPVSQYPAIHSNMLKTRTDYAKLNHTLSIFWRRT